MSQWNYSTSYFVWLTTARRRKRASEFLSVHANVCLQGKDYTKTKNVQSWKVSASPPLGCVFCRQGKATVLKCKRDFLCYHQ